MKWKTPITLLTLVVILVAGAYFGWRGAMTPAPDDVSNSEPATPTEEPGCTKVTKVQQGKRVNAEDVLVNVYNAGSVTGLATETLAALEDKGFRPGVADNAPPGATATNVTILAKSRRDPEVRLVALQFKGKVTFGSDDPGSGVDVVVGDQFDSIDSKAKTVFVTKHAVTTCKHPPTSAP